MSDTEPDFEVVDCSQFKEKEYTSRKRTDSESTNNIEYSNSDCLSTSTSQKNCDNFSEKLAETMEVFQKYIINKSALIPTPVEETVNSAFMKSATIILSSLQPINQVRARADIMKCLCDIQMEELMNK